MPSTLLTSLALAILVACVLPKVLASDHDKSKYNISTRPNAPFVALYFFRKKPISVTIGGHEAPEGSSRNFCTTGSSCWKALSDRQCSILTAIPRSGQGSIILYPNDTTKSPSTIVVKTNASDVQTGLLPSGLGEVLKPRLNDTSETMVTVVYDEEVMNTDVRGKMEFSHKLQPPFNGSVLEVPYLEEKYRGRIGVLLTGEVKTTAVECVLNFSKMESALIVITPDEHSPESTVLRVPFIASSGTSSITTSSYASHLVSPFVLFLAISICVSQ
ncbi:hypothetical protein SprV_0802481800 [Sparganum proliferum]